MKNANQYNEIMHQFEHPEDQIYFEELFLKEGKVGTIEDFMHLFDFREYSVKRNEFRRVRKERFQVLQNQYGLVCMLQMECCEPRSGYVLDHVIPIYTNELNKRIRRLKPEPGKKVKSQSFGSNHVDNLVLACNSCNNHKKHLLLDKEKLSEIFRLKGILDLAVINM